MTMMMMKPMLSEHLSSIITQVPDNQSAQETKQCTIQLYVWHCHTGNNTLQNTSTALNVTLTVMTDCITATIFRRISPDCVFLCSHVTSLQHKSDDWQAAMRAEFRHSCAQRYTQVRPWLVATLTYIGPMYGTGAGHVQARPHGVQLSAQPSTTVPRRPLPVCIQCRLQTTLSLCQPRSSCCASLSSQQLRSAAFSVAGPAIWNWLPDSMRDPAISRDSFRRSLKTFLFSAYCVHGTLELSGRCALQIYLLTYLDYTSVPRIP